MNPSFDAQPEHPERPTTVAADAGSCDQAHDVQTVVIEEHGRWAVEIVVVFADGVVRKRINAYATKARAELAADLMKRAAERDIGPGPING